MEKKKYATFILIGLISVLCLSLSGCDKKEEKSLRVNVEDLTNRLLTGLTFNDTLNEIDQQVLCDIYDLDSNDFIEAKSYISTGATAEEIIVIKVKDKEKRSFIEEKMKKRIEDQKSSYENYNTDELAKLNQAIIRVLGDSVILCVCDDSNKAATIINGYMAILTVS